MLGLAGQAEAEIGYDTAASTADVSNADNLVSLSFTVGAAGVDRLLVVGACAQDATLADRTVSAVTYAGANFTQIRADDNTGNNAQTALWYLTAPATGANTLTVTFNPATNPTNQAVVGVVSLTGVDQSAPLDAHNGFVTTTASSTYSVTVTTVADNAWLVDSLCRGNGDDMTAGANQLERWDLLLNTRQGVGSTAGPKTPPGAEVMDWSSGNSRIYATAAASFKPAKRSRPSGSGQYPAIY